jgi:hypothetical protein
MRVSERKGTKAKAQRHIKNDNNGKRKERVVVVFNMYI